MNATIISYLAGMGGDFLSYLSHKNSNYYPITEIKQTHHNMWMFPNMLEPIGSEVKVYPSDKPWPVDDKSLSKLNEIYGNYNILLPTHWYNQINHNMTNGLFDKGVRLYARETKILRASYAMWWIKSHVIANEPWEIRKQEMQQMIVQLHPRANLIKDMLENGTYHNWKFLAIKHDFLINETLDLSNYINKHFNLLYSKGNARRIYRTNYLHLPIDDLLYNTDSIDMLEEYLDTSIDKEQVMLYTETNMKMLQDTLNVSINSSDFLGDNFYSLIKEYAEYFIEKRTHFNDYYNGTSN